MMPNPCAKGKRWCIVKTIQGNFKTVPTEDTFKKCKFFDENFEFVDCGVEKDTRDYVGQ